MSKFNSDYNKHYKQICKNHKNFPSILPAVDRIVVIGDIHGDFEYLKECLRVGKIIDVNDNYIGGNTVVVQLGDQIDSCRPNKGLSCIEIRDNQDKPDDVKILKYMTELHTKAEEEGGAIYSIIGNHELMNVIGDMRYVSYQNIISHGKDVKTGMINRIDKFKPGNELANFLGCTRKMALIVGNHLFVHAGILPQIAERYSVDDLNHILSLYLWNHLENDKNYSDVLDSNLSPLWNRKFGNLEESQYCDTYMGSLKENYKVGNIYVGHTPQLLKGMNSVCNNNVWKVDTGGSYAFNAFDKNLKQFNEKQDTRKAQVLEILNDTDIKILK